MYCVMSVQSILYVVVFLKEAVDPKIPKEQSTKFYISNQEEQENSHLLQNLTFKVPNKNCSRQHFNFILLSFKENEA